jgi:TonB family protein
VPSLLQPSRPEKSRWALTLSLLPLSVAVHAALIGVLLGVGALMPRPFHAPQEKRPVSLRRLDAQKWAANRGAARSAQRLERPAPLHPEGQVVDVAPGNNRRPEDSKYLATSDNQVKSETRAREQTRTWSRATPRTQTNPEAQPSAKGHMPSATQPPPSGVSLAESLLGRRTPIASLLPQTVSGTNDDAQAQGPVGTESGTQTSGTDTTEGGGAPNDALDDVPQGDGTSLNTREWKYAGFFNRVKQAVSAKWDPNHRLAQKNHSLGALVRITVMHVTLRPDGSLADLFVAQSSGLDELDAEAMAAFEKAAPFPNPPPALVEGGAIRFSFSFHVSHSGLAVPMPFKFR